MSSREIRDPIHGFIRVDGDETKVLDSVPVQRLRHIHQLALSYLVYPGATHRRFEHSLGVMELAGRVFDVVTARANVHRDVASAMPEISESGGRRDYWRRVVRMAALCHDIGHLPFSHAAEHKLLPDGWDHERLTVELIRSPEMEELWRRMTPPLRSEDIVKVAVGQKKLPKEKFKNWEAVLSEIIVGDALGVDRMDYLLRDSLHAGVAYGRFDHLRLIDSIRILPLSTSEEGSREPHLGVEAGGLHSAEALLLARYFMFSQVYFHDVRRIYDVHLKDFLSEWLQDGRFSIDLTEHLKTTDTEVLAAMLEAARDGSKLGHDSAERIVKRTHFKLLWERSPRDLANNPDPGSAIAAAAREKYGLRNIRRDSESPKSATEDFPVQQDDGQVESAYVLSHVLDKIPAADFDYVFVNREQIEDARTWLERERENVLARASKESE